MGGELALASVTAILKHRLENGLIDRAISSSIGSDITVSALSPDRIAVGADERPQLNLFLYQATPNTGLHPLKRGDDKKAAKTKGLALDLHYLLTAYGAHDLEAEILLGYTLQMFQETPALPADAIRTTLASLAATGNGRAAPALAALATSPLAEQIEEITIRPQFLSTEEMSRLWSAMQARFRPSAAYKVSVVVLNGNA